MSDNKKTIADVFEEGLDAWHTYVYEVETKCPQSSVRIAIPRNPYPSLTPEAKAWHEGFMFDRIY